MIAAGTRLGPYEILAPLGAGGMGEVWRAKDTTLDREVALKFLPASVANDAERLARFDREAKVLASLNHPSIAAIYGFHDEGGQRFLAMEMVPGLDLAERLKSGRLPIQEALDVALQIAEALEAAHERGIVHRDLKPANVKLTPDGKVKVLDFGLAKALDARPDGSRDASMSPTITSLGTVSGVILGTAAYMSPEAARGRTVDKRADNWAFGCVLYEMLTGQLAFPGETVSDTMAAVLTREPDWSALPAGTPAHVKALIARCLVKEPKERLRDIGDGRIALEEAPARAESVAVSRSVPMWMYGVVVAVAALAVIGGLVFGRKAAVTRPPVFRPLTVGNGIVQSARFTSDGGTVIYGSAFDGRPLSLFSMRADGLESRPIDLPSADIAGISRDSKMALLLGRHYAGSWLRTGTLAQVALTGGTPRELLENVFDADISPDGSQFAVVVGDGGDQVLQYPIGKEVFRSHGWIGQPRIAPDGKRVAFVDHRVWGDDLGEIKLIDVDGKVRLLGSEQQYTQGCAWAPDGKTVWYSNSSDFEGGQVFAVEPGRPPRLVMRIPGIVRLQDVASDGRVLIVTDDTWITLAGELAGDMSERVYSLGSNDTAAGISADGSSYAGSDNVVIDGDYTVFFRRGDAPAVRLGPGLTVGMTPDAKWVLATTTLKETRGLTLLPVGAGQPRPLDLHGVLYSGLAGHYLQFSSDGRRFAFVGSKGTEGRAAYVFDLGDGVPRKVSREGATGAVISIDGTKVAVADPVRGMYVVSSAGQVPVAGVPKEEVPLGWTADSAAVLSWDQTLPPRIMKTDLATGKRELFRELRPVDPVGTAYGWLLISPDGKYYLQRCRRMRSAVVLVTPHG
ncbi:MAG TPA: protein kinase [Candidatus Polarisedimenticolaceae bacterium]|nr:protein kinase [Candidatus Polarisedimenticolaceae bacterium]